MQCLQACALASERGVYMRKLESSLRAAKEEISQARREAKKIKKLSSAAVRTSAWEEALTQENEGLWAGVPCEWSSKDDFFFSRKSRNARHADKAWMKSC